MIEDPSSDLKYCLVLSEIAEGLEKSKRATGYADGSSESTAAHTVHLALLALRFAARDHVNTKDAVICALLHDLADARTPDINTVRGLGNEAHRRKKEHEREVFATIVRDTGLHVALDGAFLSPESGPAGAWVWAMDKVVPKLLHLRDDGLSLRRGRFTAAEVAEAHATQRREVALICDAFRFHFVLSLYDWACGQVQALLRSHEEGASP